MSIEQLDDLNCLMGLQLYNLEMYIGAISGALLIQQDAIENENWALVWDTNRDMRAQIDKVKRVIGEPDGYTHT